MKSAAALVVVLAFAASCSAIPKKKSALIIGEYLYFPDATEARSREAAVAYCNDEGGELAKITNTQLFLTLRTAARITGSYWIDGIDRNDVYRFQMNQTCTYENYFNFYGMPPNSLDIPAISCLALERGAAAAKSKIVAANCSEEKFVFCQYPLNGCQNGATTEYSYRYET